MFGLSRVERNACEDRKCRGTFVVSAYFPADVNVRDHDAALARILKVVLCAIEDHSGPLTAPFRFYVGAFCGVAPLIERSPDEHCCTIVDASDHTELTCKVLSVFNDELLMRVGHDYAQWHDAFRHGHFTMALLDSHHQEMPCAACDDDIVHKMHEIIPLTYYEF